MPTVSAIEKSLAIMKENGLKYTKKREEMLCYLARCNRYVSAKEIHTQLSAIFSGLSFDTIYRNLSDFCALDLVEMTDFEGEKKFRFHCKEDEHKHHHHFICTVCGKTKEIDMCPMDFFEAQLAGCQIQGHRFEILGKCEDCC
ncbi:MAG: transcriptional repressor [Lactobacillales bacterium]|nr:transcriptional repressor [Lactobacillales bacterium]